MNSLFDQAAAEGPRPLADRMRPKRLSEVVGQDHLVGPDGTLTRALSSGRIPSIIFWGPPGTGKTTLSRLLAGETGLVFEQMSAIFSGVADLKKAFEQARMRREQGRSTLLFVDEIHRFNKSQQDSFLPFVENGTITLVGATTENPSFELNGALLSRCQVLVLNRLDTEALDGLLRRAELHEKRNLPLDPDARKALIHLADGDGRYLLNLAEEVFATVPEGHRDLDSAGLSKAVSKRLPLYDKAADGHYNLISALHKSVRGSDPDAALYYLARMLVAGEDPLFIARRVVRMAIEDIGLADPEALQQALAAKDAFDFLGSPEGELALAQAVIYVATAPKSNAGYNAFKAAMAKAQTTGSLMPPKTILNAPTKMMKEQEFGSGYRYDHDEPNAFSGQDYFPREMGRTEFYKPVDRGFEREIAKRLDFWSSLRQQRNGVITGQ
jgi:putative ATPase